MSTRIGHRAGTEKHLNSRVSDEGRTEGSKHNALLKKEIELDVMMYKC